MLRSKLVCNLQLCPALAAFLLKFDGPIGPNDSTGVNQPLPSIILYSLVICAVKPDPVMYVWTGRSEELSIYLISHVTLACASFSMYKYRCVFLRSPKTTSSSHPLYVVVQPQTFYTPPLSITPQCSTITSTTVLDSSKLVYKGETSEFKLHSTRSCMSQPTHLLNSSTDSLA